MALYPNGRAPASALVNYRGVVASPDMARRVAWVEREYMRRNPDGYITPNEIYRTYADQVYWKKYWTDRGQPGNAADPGDSNHGDWDIGAVDWDADNIALRSELAAQVGLVRTMPSESWHYAVRGPSSVALPSLSYSNTTPINTEEDELMGAKEEILAGISKMLNENLTHTNIVRNEKTGAIAAVNYAAGFWYPAQTPDEINTWIALNIVPVGEPVQNLDDGSFRYAQGVAGTQLGRIRGVLK